MVALAILSGAVVALLASFNYHLGVASGSRDEVLATALGLEKMEEIKLGGKAEALEGTFGKAYPEYRWSLVQEDTALKGIKRLELKVSREKGRPFFLVSYIKQE